MRDQLALRVRSALRCARRCRPGPPQWRSGRRLLLVLAGFVFRGRFGRRRIEALDDGAVHVERDLVDLAELDAHARAAREALRARDLEHQRQRVGARQRAVGHVLDQRRLELGDVLLLQVLERPEALHAALVRVVGGIGGIEAREDGEQVGVLRLEGRRQRGGLAVARGRDDLPLVHQVGVAAQRRGAPGIALHAEAGMRQGAGPHAHLDARRQAGLAAVERRARRARRASRPSCCWPGSSPRTRSGRAARRAGAW